MTSSTVPPLDRNDLEKTEAAVLATVQQIAQELHRGREALPASGLDSSLSDDFAYDSLARVELGQRLEQIFSISLVERLLFEADTPRDLLRAVIKANAGVPMITLKASHAPNVASDQLLLPHQATNLLEMLQWHVAEHGQRTHIQFYDDLSDGATISYSELYDGAMRIAGALQQHGLEPQQQVALMLPTGRAYFFSFFAILIAGGVPVPIYPPVRRQQLEDHLRRQSRILHGCQAVILITERDSLSAARLLTASVASLHKVLDASELEHHSGTAEMVHAVGEDTAFLQYTSGSTGDPKGVVLSHFNLLSNIRANGQGMGVGSNDVFVSWLPLYHDMGLIGAWLGSLYHGLRFVVMPPLSFLARPERWLWAIDRYNGTLSAAPNFAYELCVKRINEASLKGLDLSRWRAAANGAEAISPETLSSFSKKFAPYGFQANAMMPVYGLAECSVGLAFTPLGRGPLIDTIDRNTLSTRGEALPSTKSSASADRLQLVACGVPLPKHEIRIVDLKNREVPERHEGRVQFRGPSATSGYFCRPDATAALLSDGWLNSGDRGYIAAGELFITGRSKDIIIRAGRNLYPPELEDAIGELNGIRKGYVAVFGVDDNNSGTERVVVLAETRRRQDAARTALVQQINALSTDLIAGPADDVVLAPPNTVLRTSSGKIRRSACRDLYLDGDIGKSPRAPWLQITSLLIAGVVPQLRRLRRRAATTVFAAWSWLVFVSSGALAWLLTWLPLPRQWLWRGIRGVIKLTAALTAMPIKVNQLENIPPAGQATIVVANHQSYLDGMLMLAVLPRPPHFLIKGELRHSRLLARPLTRVGCVFVERFDAAGGVESLDEVTALLRDGQLVVVFPEGTFKRMPGVLPFHMGAFMTAAKTGATLIPAALHGTRSILRAGSWFPRRGAVNVQFGQSVTASQPSSDWLRALALRDGARVFIIERCAEPDLADESNAVDGSD